MQLMLLTERTDGEFRAAVAVVRDGQKWLLGLSKSSDDRSNKWCAPGGGLRSGESPMKAAEREAREELGMSVTAIGGLFEMPDHPKIAFVPCRGNWRQSIRTNHEFSHAGWFTEQEMKGLVLYKNAKELIRRAQRFH